MEMFFLQYVQIEYQNLDYKNYLVLRQKQTLRPIDYCCRMVEQNHIIGLLPMYCKRLNDKIDFFYDISGKQRLTDYLEHNRCTDEQGRQILLNMAESLRNLPQYFLKQQFCIMDLQYVFINNALQVFFPLLPLVEMLDNHNNIQDFFRHIVSDYFVTEANNQFFDGLLKYLSRQQFDLLEFIERLQPKTQFQETSDYQAKPVVAAPIADETPEPKTDKAALRWPFGAKSNKNNKPEKSENQPSVTPAQGIKIPGMPDIAMPAAEPAPEKKHLFGGKKNKEKPVKEKPAKEKPVKEPKLKGGLFGAKNKDKQKKDEPLITVPETVQPNPPAAPAVPSTPAYTVQTVMIASDDFGETVYLAESKKTCCYLYHDNYRVDINKTPFVLGKQNVDYQINKAFISRVHAVITSENADYYIQDENSKNHTYLNGEQLPPYTPYKLSNGSKIRLGSEELTFYYETGK